MENNTLKFDDTKAIAKYLQKHKVLEDEEINHIGNALLEILQTKYNQQIQGADPNSLRYSHETFARSDYNLCKKILSYPNIDNEMIVKILSHFQQERYDHYAISKIVRGISKNEEDVEKIIKMTWQQFDRAKEDTYLQAFLRMFAAYVKLNKNTIAFVFNKLNDDNNNYNKYYKTWFCINLLYNNKIENFDLNIAAFKRLPSKYKIVALKKCNLNLVDLTKVYTESNNRYVKDEIGKYLEKTEAGKKVLGDLKFLNIGNNSRTLDLKIRRRIIKEIRSIDSF